MISLEQIVRNDKQEEIQGKDYQESLFMTLDIKLDKFIGKCYPWHWHRFFEITYVVSGRMEYATPGRNYILSSGDIIFANANVLHTIRAAHGMEGCEIKSILLESRFLTGLFNNRMEEKYFRPLRTNSGCASLYFPAGSSVNKKMEKSIHFVLESDTKQEYGYEFCVQQGLAEFFGIMIPHINREGRLDNKSSDVDINRVKSIMMYINKNYQKKLTLDDIAENENISRRECSRCFKKVMGITPIQFLTFIRINAAAELLKGTDKPVAEISEECGFASASYFTSVFQKVHGILPKEYRK